VHVQRRTWSAIGLGGIFGGIVGIALVALAAGRVIGSGILSVEVPNEPARATFLVQQSALYVLITVASAVAGAFIAVIGYAVGRLADPGEQRFRAAALSIVGAISGAILGFAVARAAIGVGGTIAEGMVSLSVFRAAMVALVTGATTGAVLAGGVERLSRPEVVGLAGAAWPSNPIAFLRDAAAAIGLPALALIGGLAIVYGLSQVLLESDHTTALITFSGVAALVLFGAAVIAALPPRRGGDDA
jgi:hypothetical protein